VKDVKGDTYGTIPRVATADGRERIPTETFSAIMTTKTVRDQCQILNISDKNTHACRNA
jgi:hypothetical protein